MTKKIIQIPIDESLLKDLDTMCKKQRKARSALIRQACKHYLEQVEREELDRLYQRGYVNIPEEPEIGEAQEVITGEIMSKEPW